MDSHDEVRELGEILADKEFLQKVSPKFNELSLDLNEVMAKSSDPVLIAVLLFKLVEERQKTNQILERLYDKVDSILKKIDSNTSFSQHEGASQQRELPELVLPEQDQLILHLVREKGQVTAEEIRKDLGYKGNNAASQRLNKLYKEGYLKKIQAGRKVMFLAKILDRLN